MNSNVHLRLIGLIIGVGSRMSLTTLALMVSLGASAPPPVVLIAKQGAVGTEGVEFCPSTIATPRSDPQLVARALSLMPQGRRALLITDFGELLFGDPADKISPPMVPNSVAVSVPSSVVVDRLLTAVKLVASEKSSKKKFSVKPLPTPSRKSLAKASRKAGKAVAGSTTLGGVLPAPNLVVPSATIGPQSSAVKVAGPWFEIGESRTALWAQSLVSTLVAKGASVDFLIIDCDGDLSAARLLGSAVSTRVIEADSRWATFATRFGLPLQIMPGGSAPSPSFVAAWNVCAVRWQREATGRAVAAAFQRTWPAIATTYTVRSLVATAVSGLPAGSESVLGIGLPGNSLPYSTLLAGLSRIELQGAITGLPQSPWLCDATVSGSELYWGELVTHLHMRGAKALLLNGTPPTTTDRERATSLISAVGVGTRLLGSWTLQASAETPTGGAIVAATAVQSEQTVVWRISFNDASQGIHRFRFEDGSTLDVVAQPGTAGAWIRHSVSQRLVLEPNGAPLCTSPVDAAPSLRPVLVNSSPVNALDFAESGASRYVTVYQDVQPGSRGTVDIDVQRVLGAARRELSRTNASWGVLDWESPHFSIINAGSSHPQYAAAIQNICDALDALRAEFPTVRWTIWGGLELPYWLNGENWSSFSEETRSTLGAVSLSNWTPILDHCDWMMPWSYDVYDEEIVPTWFKESLPIASAKWLSAKVEAGRAYQVRSGRSIPIIACLCPYFIGGGLAREGSAIPEEQLIRDQVGPAAQCGVDGIAIWSPTDWWSQVINLDKEVLNEPQREVQTTVRSLVDTAVGTAVDWSQPSATALANTRLEGTIGRMLRIAREHLSATSIAGRIVH
jgi:hypothetical protein